MQTTIPHYALYGENAQPGWANTFHVESIPHRSRPYHWEIRPHMHDAFMQILLLQKGSAEVTLNGERHTLYAPCLMLIPSQNVHGFRFSHDVDGPIVTTAQKTLESIAAVVMPELIATIRTPALITLSDTSRYRETLVPLLIAIEQEWRMHATGQVAAGMSLLTALLVQIARLKNSAASHAQPSVSRGSAQVEKFRALLDESFKTRNSVDFYACKLGVTAGQLSRLCRERLGMSALGVINARIVHEAQRELVYSSLAIKQVAASLGFADEAYFARFFKKNAGTSPALFRSKAREQIAR